MTKLGYFDAKRNKPRSPNYKIEKFDIYKETHIFLVLTYVPRVATDRLGGKRCTSCRMEDLWTWTSRSTGGPYLSEHW